MPESSHKAELIDRIRTAHDKLASVLAAVPPAEMEQPGVTELWSVKDALAHLTYWEQEVVTYMAQVERGEQPPDDLLPGETNQQRLDRLNAATYQRNHDRPLADVQADFERSYQEVLSMVDAWTEEDVAHGGRLEQLLGFKIEEGIAGDTWEHYEEHGDQIAAWWANRGEMAAE